MLLRVSSAGAAPVATLPAGARQLAPSNTAMTTVQVLTRAA
jgi:hypothetical protein